MLPDFTPTHDQVVTWLAEQHHPQTWASFLTGLPWRYLRPLVKMAGASKVHPALALATAAAYSRDPELKRVAGEHLASQPGALPLPEQA